MSVDSGSPAAEQGVRPGDRLHAIDGHPIRDAIDLRFYGAGESIHLEISRGARKRRLVIDKAYGGDAGLDVEPFRVRSCRNNCLFCFVRQQPKGLRRSLYVRDDDYRMSFLHGAYITATNLTRADLWRIKSQRLTPLYLSVHATDGELRGRLLGRGRPTPILPFLDFLAARRLRFHAQIVLCPGINDGRRLEQTLEDLCAFYPYCQSIAVVPAGLTRHRRGLPRLRAASKAYVRRVVESTIPLRKRLARRLGRDIIYLSDEFYLLGGLRLPPYSRREYWHQLENGVGMVHEFYRGFRPSRLPKRVATPQRVGLVTGRLGSLALKKLVVSLNRVERLKVEALVVRNRLFGDTVTVSGLLSGRDVCRAIEKNRGRFDRFVIPGNCLTRPGGLFLDGVAYAELEWRLGGRVSLGGACANQIATSILS